MGEGRLEEGGEGRRRDGRERKGGGVMGEEGG